MNYSVTTNIFKKGNKVGNDTDISSCKHAKKDTQESRVKHKKFLNPSENSQQNKMTTAY